MNLRAANVFFDGLNLITRAWFERRTLPFVLDTAPRLPSCGQNLLILPAI